MAIRTVRTVNDRPVIDPNDLRFLWKMALSVSVDGQTVFLTTVDSDDPLSVVGLEPFSPNAVFATYVLPDGTYMFQQMNPALQKADRTQWLFVGFFPTGALGNDYYVPVMIGNLATLSDDSFGSEPFTVGNFSRDSPSITLWDDLFAQTITVDGQQFYCGQIGPGEGRFMMFPKGAQPSWGVKVFTPAWPNMNGADFDYTLLHNYTLSGASLAAATFIDADLSGSQITSCNLTNAVLTDADLSGATWRQNTMGGAKLQDTNLTGASFQDCVMAGADLTGAAFSPATSFAGADLTNATFSPNADLRGVNFTGAILTGASLTGADLTGATFSPAVTAKGTDLRKATLTGDDLNGVDFTGAKLAGANLTGATFRDANLSGADLTGATAANTDFTSIAAGTQLTGTIFTDVDLTTAAFDATPHFSTDPTKLTRFDGATLHYKVIGTNWSYLDLTGATVVDLPKALSSSSAKLTAQYAVIASLNEASGELTKAILQCADFSYASIGVLDASYADFTGATFAQTTFAGTTLDNAILENVKATGAHFGGLLPLITLDPSADKALNASDIPTLAALFEPHGIVLSAGTTVTKTRGVWKITGAPQSYTVMKDTPALNAPPVITVYGAPTFAVDASSTTQCEQDLDQGPRPNADLMALFSRNGAALSSGAAIALDTAVWSIVDETNNASYTARMDTPQQGAATLVVYVSGASVTLVGAHLSGATLDGAGLDGAAATRADFSGEGTSLQNADLEDANLSNADLLESNLDQAQLQGASLDNAILINASMTGVFLTRDASGKMASLSSASLQGVDFTNALLYGADLTNAAVGVQIGSGSDQGTGVYLFSLPASVKTLLDEAATAFTLNGEDEVAQFSVMLQAMNSQTAAGLAAIRAAFATNGVALSDSARIAPTPSAAPARTWQVLQGSNVAYTVWSGAAPSDLQAYGPAGTFMLNPTSDPTALATLVAALNNQNLPPLQTVFAGQGHPIADTADVEPGDEPNTWVVSSDTSVYLVSAAQNDLPVAPQFSLNPAGDPSVDAKLVAALNAGDLSTLAAAFSAQQYPLAASATIEASGAQWNITDTVNYTVWVRLGRSGNPVMHAAPSNNALALAFSERNYTLEPAATVENGDESGWFIDNDSGNPDDRHAGFIKLQVLDLTPDPLDVYGTTLRMQHVRADGTAEIVDRDCEQTTLDPTNMGPETVCPNGQTFQTNRTDGSTTWNDWMRATTPPDGSVREPSAVSAAAR